MKEEERIWKELGRIRDGNGGEGLNIFLVVELIFKYIRYEGKGELLGRIIEV